jgi:hypothetical protein
MGECRVQVAQGSPSRALDGSQTPPMRCWPASASLAPCPAADRNHAASRCGSRRSARSPARCSARRTTSPAWASCLTRSPTRDM